MPLPPDEIAALFGAATPAFDDVTMARLTHFDLWDGNVLVRQGPDGWTVSGLVDWERAFFGDPLADVVCLTLLESPAERAALLQALAEGGGPP